MHQVTTALSQVVVQPHVGPKQALFPRAVLEFLPRAPVCFGSFPKRYRPLPSPACAMTYMQAPILCAAITCSQPPSSRSPRPPQAMLTCPRPFKQSRHALNPTRKAPPHTLAASLATQRTLQQPLGSCKDAEDYSKSMVRGRSLGPAPASMLHPFSSPSQARETPVYSPVPSVACVAATYDGMSFFSSWLACF